MKDFLSSFGRQITLKQLRGFAAIVRNGTITEAARELHLTTPAVSLQLRDLQEVSGMPLLEKHQKKLIPTIAGKLVFQLIDSIDKNIAECGNSLDQMGGIDRGLIHVGVVSTARYFVPTILAAFNKQYPNVNLKLMVGNRALIMENLESLELDFVIAGLPPDHFGVDMEFIDDHPQIIIARPGSEFSDKSCTPLSALSNQTFLLREVGSGTRSMTEKFFKKSDFCPKNSMEFGSNETIKQAVMAGMGVALISAHTVAAELEANRLEALRVTGLPLNRKWYVIKHKDKHLFPSALALWNYILKSGKGYIPKLPANGCEL